MFLDAGPVIRARTGCALARTETSFQYVIDDGAWPRLIEGDATEVLAEMEGTFDFIFMDAAKGQYIHYLPNVLRLLSDGGCLVSDNVMQDGDIIESRFAVERRNRTIHARMREYLYELKHREDLVTSIIPLGDGVAVSIKQGVEK